MSASPGVRRALNVLVVLAGVAFAVWGIVGLAHPTISCRGVTMHAGDTCEKSGLGTTNTGTVQTYEQRLHSAQASRPLVIGAGLVVAGFGGFLMLQDVRRGQSTDRSRRRAGSVTT